MRHALAVSPVGLIFTWLTLSGCHSVLSLSDYQVQDEQVASTSQAYVCRMHAECPGPAGPATATFCTNKRRCASLQSEDCTRLAGSEQDANVLVVGSLFGTTGPDAAAELARQRAVQLAVEEINTSGGIPLRDGAEARELVLVGCDTTTDVDRAAKHLATLGTRAILGLTDSEQLLQVVRSHAIAAGMLTLSAAIAPDSINSLLDADLAWLMTLTVEQRAPLFDSALSALEQHLRAERSQPLRLGLLYRYDGAGRAGLSSLRLHEFDGQALGEPELHGGRVRIDRYPDNAAELPALVASYRAFAPDIVVVLGSVDALPGFMSPLEQSYERDAASVRPHYVLSEEAKGPGLIELARELPSVRERIHGVGAAIPDRSRPVWERFQRRYVARFNDELGAAPRVAAVYDALYALAYAIAAIEAEHEVGGRIAQALHWLEAPEQTAAPVYEVGPEALGRSLRKLSAGERVGLDGASGELHWDDYGALRAGALELWCMEAVSGAVRYGNAPLRYDVAAQRFGTRAASCDPWLKPLSGLRGVDSRAQADMAARRADSNEAIPQAAGNGNDAGAAGSGAPRRTEQPASAGAEAPSGAAGASAPSPAEPAPDDMQSAAPKAIACGASACDHDNEQCCIAMLRPLAGSEDGNVTCQPRSAAAPAQAGAAGSAAPAACALNLQCASDVDCSEGTVCCVGAQLASCVAREVCGMEMARRLACKSSAECPQGQLCCMHSGPPASAFSFTACEPSCDFANASVRLCTGDADCQNDAASSDCNPSSLLPALSVCWPRL